MMTNQMRKQFNRAIFVSVWILEIFTLFMCEKNTKAPEAYNAAEKVSETNTNKEFKEANEFKKAEETEYIIESAGDDSVVSNVINPVYGMSFFSTDPSQLDKGFTISSEKSENACFFIDAVDQDLLSENTVLEENTKLNDKVTVLLGREDTWGNLLGQYVYLYDRNYMWSYQIFGVYPTKKKQLENIGGGNREEFNDYFNALFQEKNNSYHLSVDLKQQVLEDWHVLSIYMPHSTEDGCVIQATLRSITSL